jgi:hypothetical protein
MSFYACYLGLYFVEGTGEHLDFGATLAQLLDEASACALE